MRYEKLKVWDSNGQELAARMQTNERSGDVWLEVQDASAVYPLTIDPVFVSMTKLTASDNGLGFGGAVAISGDTAIVGASSATVGTNSFQGAAYVFIKTASGWSEQQKLSAADGAPSDNFGEAVAIDGDTVIVSAISDDLGTGNNQGSAYIFIRNGTTWSQQQKLTASDSENGDNFGISVAINGNTAVVGVPYDVIGGVITQGSVYVYVRNGTTWSEQQHIIGSQTAPQGEFGSSVGIEDDTLIVGAWLDTVDGKSRKDQPPSMSGTARSGASSRSSPPTMAPGMTYSAPVSESAGRQSSLEPARTMLDRSMPRVRPISLSEAARLGRKRPCSRPPTAESLISLASAFRSVAIARSSARRKGRSARTAAKAQPTSLSGTARCGLRTTS